LVLASATTAAAQSTCSGEYTYAPFTAGGGLPASTQPVRLVGRSFSDQRGEFNALGTTFFWGACGFRFDRQRLEQNLDFIARSGFDYIRVLGTVGGATWEDRTVDPRWSDYDAVIAGLTDLAYDVYGLRVQWTIFGETDFTPTVADRVTLIDRLLRMSRGREHKIILFEIANEAWQNGFPDCEGIRELRGLTRRMKDNTDILVAASWWIDPSGFCQLYAGGVADIATVHFERANTFGDGVWRPVRQPWGWPGEFPCTDLPPAAVNNEPIGPYSSVAEDRDPLRLTMGAVVTYIAGLPAYTLHTGAGIRGGGAADLARGRPANIWEVENIDQTVRGLRAAKGYLPPGLANWARHNALWPSYPFSVDADQFVRAYAATTGNQVVVGPIGMRNPVTMAPKSAMVLSAVNPLTGDVVAQYSLAAGQSFTLPTADALVLRSSDDSLAAGGTLAPGQARTSADGRFTFVYQGDGNLVLYQRGAGPLWASNTAGTSAGQTIMQGDGNLVVYDAANQPVWASGTVGNPGARLVVQNDGNVVIYSAAGAPLWATGTCCR
jgi:hypothetical protein